MLLQKCTTVDKEIMWQIIFLMQCEKRQVKNTESQPKVREFQTRPAKARPDKVRPDQKRSDQSRQGQTRPDKVRPNPKQSWSDFSETKTLNTGQIMAKHRLRSKKVFAIDVYRPPMWLWLSCRRPGSSWEGWSPGAPGSGSGQTGDDCGRSVPFGDLLDRMVTLHTVHKNTKFVTN